MKQESPWFVKHLDLLKMKFKLTAYVVEYLFYV